MLTKNQQGFTLIEVMIVVAIVAILAAIALPSYRSSVLKGNRSDGYAILNEIMQAQERYAASNDIYVTNLALLGYADPQNSPEGYFSVTASVCNGAPAPALTACVRLVATAQNRQDQDSNDNSADAALTPGDMSLNSRGTKVGWK